MLVQAIKTRIFQEHESLKDFIFEHMARWSSPWGEHQENTGNSILKNGDILVITSKIVALSEWRTAPITTKEDKIRLIESESTWHKKTPYAHLAIHDNIPMMNAGIDESNAQDKYILLPKHPYHSAFILWEQLKTHYQIENLGVIITDSHTPAFRNGTVGFSLGHAGFEAIADYRGKVDIFGRGFHYAHANVVDALAASAVHVMGEWDEMQPLAIIRDAGVSFTGGEQNGDSIIIPPENDLYRAIFEK